MTVPLYNLTDTWNNAGTVFTAIQMTVTNTASATGSRLIDLILGTDSLLSMDKVGNLGVGSAGTGSAPAFVMYHPGNASMAVGSAGGTTGLYGWFRSTGFVGVPSGGGFEFSSADLNSNPYNSTRDLFLVRDAAAQLAQRNGTNAQTFRVYNTFTDASNYERAVFDWTTISNVCMLRAEAAGTGTQRALWMQWGGQSRVTADVSANNTTVLATTGMTVALQAGRTYSFDAYLSFTCTAAQGIRAAIVGTGGLTATAIEYDGWIIDSAANGIKGNAQSTALGTVVANAALTGTAGVVQIKGTITVNVAGNLDVQFAQSVAAANNTTVKRGSYMLVHDMP